MNILKRIFYLSITFALVGVLVTSCEKEIIEDDINQLEMIDNYQANILIEEKDNNGLNNSLRQGRCCNVGSITNLSGDPNRFGVLIKHRPNTTIHFVVYKSVPGSSYLIGEDAIFVANAACAGEYRLVNLDTFVDEPIVNGEEYFMVVYLTTNQNTSGPIASYCSSSNSITFDGEGDGDCPPCPPNTYCINGNCLAITIAE